MTIHHPLCNINKYICDFIALKLFVDIICSIGKGMLLTIEDNHKFLENFYNMHLDFYVLFASSLF